MSVSPSTPQSPDGPPALSRSHWKMQLSAGGSFVVNRLFSTRKRLLTFRPGFPGLYDWDLLQSNSELLFTLPWSISLPRVRGFWWGHYEFCELHSASAYKFRPQRPLCDAVVLHCTNQTFAKSTSRNGSWRCNLVGNLYLFTYLLMHLYTYENFNCKNQWHKKSSNFCSHQRFAMK